MEIGYGLGLLGLDWSSNKGGLREVGEGGGRVSSAIAGWLGWTLVGPQASAGRCVPGTTGTLLSARPSGTAVTPFILLGHAGEWCRVRSKFRVGAARDGVVDMGRCMFAAYLALVVATGRHIPSLLGGGGVRSYRVGWTCMVYVASGKEIAWIVIHVDGIKRLECNIKGGVLASSRHHCPNTTNLLAWWYFVFSFNPCTWVKLLVTILSFFNPFLGYCLHYLFIYYLDHRFGQLSQVLYAYSFCLESRVIKFPPPRVLYFYT